MSVLNRIRTAYWWTTAVRQYSDRRYDLALHSLARIRTPYSKNKRILCLKGNLLLLLRKDSGAIIVFDDSIKNGLANNDVEYLDKYADMQIMSLNRRIISEEIEEEIRLLMKHTRRLTIKLLPPPFRS